MIIDNSKLDGLLNVKAEKEQLTEILNKSKKLERLSLKEVALLLNVEDKASLEQIFEAARNLKNEIYGKRVVIFAPLYISNLCKNECLYCAFKASNKGMKRRALNQEEIAKETLFLLKTGQKRILLVSGEAYPGEGLEYVIESIKTVYSVQDGKNNIRRLNVNISPLDIPDFKRLKEAEIGTFQLFQETYHEPTYKKLHVSGPKADYNYRLTNMDRAFTAGIDDVGIGILFGLYDYKYEVLALMQHIEHLEKEFGMGPHTVSVPRLEPATGSDIASSPPYPVSDDDFKKIIAVLRLAVPYTGIILSTRETAGMRQEAMDLGVSQLSAGSRTNPGGYSEEEGLEQFSLGDHRSLDEVVSDICQKGYIPSFCTACYRLGRTGLDFMEYAKPGDIKKKCLPNAIFTFQEYLDDYASAKTRDAGLKMIAYELSLMPEELRVKTENSLNLIKEGKRDLFV